MAAGHECRLASSVLTQSFGKYLQPVVNSRLANNKANLFRSLREQILPDYVLDTPWVSLDAIYMKVNEGYFMTNASGPHLAKWLRQVVVVTLQMQWLCFAHFVVGSSMHGYILWVSFFSRKNKWDISGFIPSLAFASKQWCQGNDVSDSKLQLEATAIFPYPWRGWIQFLLVLVAHLPRATGESSLS